MSLSLDTTFLTNVCTWVGQAHNAYIRSVGGNRSDDDGNEAGPFYWLEAVKSVARGGNDLVNGVVANSVAVPGAPTLATAAGTTLGVGVYKYQITFVAGGETAGGTEASITTTTNNTNVSLTAIPTGPAGSGVTARKIYRTALAGATGTEKLVATLSDNTTTTYTDSLADGSLGAAIPTANTTGGTLVTAQGSPNNTVAVAAGSVMLNSQLIAIAANATYGSSTIFTQTCTDGSALTSGQFYDAALAADHLGTLSVFRGPREDRPDTEIKPPVPSGYVRLATIRVRYQAGASVIASTDITGGNTLTSFSAPANDAQARMFNDFDAGQSKMISRTAVKNELGFAMTSLDKYVTTITATQGLGTNGAGLGLIAWAKTTHQTTTPWDFPSSFIEFVRVLKNGKDPSQRLATINFTGAGTATVTDLKKVVGLQDKLELVVTAAGGTGSQPSTVSVTTQSYGAASATIWSATVPANSPNGTTIALTSSGTTALQTPLVGTAINTAINNSTVLAAQPTGTVTTKVWTALVPTSPVTVVGGQSGDNFAVRNVGTL